MMVKCLNDSTSELTEEGARWRVCELSGRKFNDRMYLRVSEGGHDGGEFIGLTREWSGTYQKESVGTIRLVILTRDCILLGAITHYTLPADQSTNFPLSIS